jgi:membrane fusion protein (multidrug efflux system)
MNSNEQVAGMNGHAARRPLPLPERAGHETAAPAIDVTPAATRSQSRRTRTLALTAGIVLLTGGAGYGVYAGQFEDTDDAQIDGNISNLSPKISGTIKAVHVTDNQRVHAGDLLAEIDPADLEVAVAQARAAVAEAEALYRAEDPTISITETSSRAALEATRSDLTSAQASVAEARKAVEQLTAQLVQAEANDKTAQVDRERAESLIKDRAIAQAEADQRINVATASAANVEALWHALEAAKERVSALLARVAVNQSKVIEARSNAPRQIEARKAAVLGRQAALEVAKAQLAQAELNLGYAKIIAPTDGIIGRRAVNVGDRVAPGQQILAISQIDGLWVTANFRETQLQHLHAGQPVEIHVDAIAGDLRGTVESTGGATGSRFSVLPPENASGNYVKVVQRIPVRIQLDPGQAGLDRLRPGMSVEPAVRVR